MYKVLLVEDEILVRLGMKNSVPWTSYDMQVVGDASDGVEALEKFISLSPDVLITDIKMYSMDGFELIKKVREINQECQIVVISCVDDFNSLREMVGYDIAGYLLKASMTMGDIDEILIKVQNSLEKQKSVILESGIQSGKHEFLTKFMFTADRKYLDLFYSHENDFVPSTLILINPITPQREDLSPLTFASIQDLIIGKFPEDSLSVLEDDGYILVSKDEVEVNDSRLKELSKTIKQYMDIELSIIIKKSSKDIANLAFEHHTVYDFFRFSNAPMCTQTVDVSQINSEEYIKLNLIALENDVKNITSDRHEEFMRNFNIVTRAAMTSFVEFQNELVCLLNWRLSIDPCNKYEINPKITRKIFNSRTLYEALKLYNYYINDSNCSSNVRISISDPALMEAIRYIDVHYKEDISLGDVASKIGFSANYFSTLFKKEIGQSYVNYLNSIRITAAKELLENTNIYFYEISELVGYNSFEYFSRIFKKKTGFCLGEWRRLNQVEQSD